MVIGEIAPYEATSTILSAHSRPATYVGKTTLLAPILLNRNTFIIFIIFELLRFGK